MVVHIVPTSSANVLVNSSKIIFLCIIFFSLSFLQSLRLLLYKTKLVSVFIFSPTNRANKRMIAPPAKFTMIDLRVLCMRYYICIALYMCACVCIKARKVGDNRDLCCRTTVELCFQNSKIVLHTQTHTRINTHTHTQLNVWLCSQSPTNSVGVIKSLSVANAVENFNNFLCTYVRVHCA